MLRWCLLTLNYSSRPWENSLMSYLESEWSRGNNFTVRAVKDLARRIRLSMSGENFGSDGAINSWWSNFKKKHGLSLDGGRYLSVESPAALWGRVMSNREAFDSILSEAMAVRKLKQINQHLDVPVILLNCDETFCLHEPSMGRLVKKRGAKLSRSVATIVGVIDT